MYLNILSLFKKLIIRLVVPIILKIYWIFIHIYKFDIFLDSCEPHKVEENQKSSIDPNLYLYDDDLESRPHISTFISSIANYENTIPAATDPDAKPPPPSARMGKD